MLAGARAAPRSGFLPPPSFGAPVVSTSRTSVTVVATIAATRHGHRRAATGATDVVTVATGYRRRNRCAQHQHQLRPNRCLLARTTHHPAFG
jgi:hypothetical protein